MIQKLTDFIIRPLRPTYNPEVDLGPTTFSIDNKYLGIRHDFEVTNRSKKKLACSLFHRCVEGTKKYPLMLFCHGNTGNRTNSYGVVYSMLRSEINVITFDFSGCGVSEGKTISLGYFEQNDISDVLNYVGKNFSFIDMNRIGIWGRSMGAVSALLYTARAHHSPSLLVLDSPFHDLPSLIRDYIQRVKIIPKWGEDYIYNNLRNKIKEQANFDFEDVSLLNEVPKCRVPALFIYGNKDAIVTAPHFKKVFEAYPVAKEYIELKISHNDPRPDSVYETAAAFARAKLFHHSFGKFEPSSKQLNLRIKSVSLTGNSLMTLDSIRFNEKFGGGNEEESDPIKQAIENGKPVNNLDCEDLRHIKMNLCEKIPPKFMQASITEIVSENRKEAEHTIPKETKHHSMPGYVKSKSGLSKGYDRLKSNHQAILEDEEEEEDFDISDERRGSIGVIRTYRFETRNHKEHIGTILPHEHHSLFAKAQL